MKRLISIVRASLKTPSDEQATDGLGATSQPQKRAKVETNTNVQSAYNSCLTKAKSSTISNPLYSPSQVSLDGIAISNVFIAEPPEYNVFATPATTLKPQPNEKSAQKLDAGTKYDKGKPALAYIPKAALYAEGEAFSYGANKYEAFNYKNGLAVTRTLGAAMRHIVQFLDGENIDEESGVHHLGCARANLAMALDTLENHPGFDDRYKEAK